MKTTIAVIVVVLLALGGYLLFANKTQAPVTSPSLNGETTSTPLETTNPNAGTSAAPVATPKTVTMTYDGTNFTPRSATLKKGDSVTFMNASSARMWVASDAHPAHTGYNGTTKDQHCPDTTGIAFDQCTAGTTYTFTFQKVGSWPFHNHANSSAQGTITVTE
jgi:plastocyanin